MRIRRRVCPGIARALLFPRPGNQDLRYPPTDRPTVAVERRRKFSSRRARRGEIAGVGPAAPPCGIDTPRGADKSGTERTVHADIRPSFAFDRYPDRRSPAGLCDRVRPRHRRLYTTPLYGGRATRVVPAARPPAPGVSAQSRRQRRRRFCIGETVCERFDGGSSSRDTDDDGSDARRPRRPIAEARSKPFLIIRRSRRPPPLSSPEKSSDISRSNR